MNKQSAFSSQEGSPNLAILQLYQDNWTLDDINATKGIASHGSYDTPIVDATLLDKLGFVVNMTTATNKTAADTSTLSLYVKVANTAHTPHNKMQGILASNMLGFNCFDAYAVQGHVTVGAGGVSTHDVNGHITGLSGKVNLVGAVGQGWVTGVLSIIEGGESVTGLCHVIAGVLESTVNDNVCDAMIYLDAGADVQACIELAGTGHMDNFIIADADSGFVVTNALVPATAPGAGTMGADRAIKIVIGATPYYIPLYATLHA